MVLAKQLFGSVHGARSESPQPVKRAWRNLVQCARNLAPTTIWGFNRRVRERRQMRSVTSSSGCQLAAIGGVEPASSPDTGDGVGRSTPLFTTPGGQIVSLGVDLQERELRLVPHLGHVLRR